jgi:RNA polymerase sigma-70 factor (ECF subfamily)
MPMTDWKELVEKCAPIVISISWRILGDAADVEDNVQDVFLEACRLDQQTTVRYWPGLLRRLATLGALAKRRQRRRHASLTEVSPPDRKTPPPEAAAIRREEEANLRDAIAALPPREGAAFALRYFENLDLPEIALCLGISYSAAGAALSRARAKLTRLFAEAEKKTDAYRKIREQPPALLGRAQPWIA